MFTVTTEKIGNWTVKAVEEKNKPAKVERYHLIGIECGYTLFDTKEKTTFTIKGDKRWENWKAAHKNEWTTDF